MCRPGNPGLNSRTWVSPKLRSGLGCCLEPKSSHAAAATPLKKKKKPPLPWAIFYKTTHRTSNGWLINPSKKSTPHYSMDFFLKLWHHNVLTMWFQQGGSGLGISSPLPRLKRSTQYTIQGESRFGLELSQRHGGNLDKSTTLNSWEEG